MLYFYFYGWSKRSKVLSLTDFSDNWTFKKVYFTLVSYSLETFRHSMKHHNQNGKVVFTIHRVILTQIKRHLGNSSVLFLKTDNIKEIILATLFSLNTLNTYLVIHWEYQDLSVFWQKQKVYKSHKLYICVIKSLL